MHAYSKGYTEVRAGPCTSGLLEERNGLRNAAVEDKERFSNVNINFKDTSGKHVQILKCNRVASNCS